MATYRYSKYDKKNGPRKRPKYIDLVIQVFNKLTSWCKSNLFVLSTLAIAVGFFILLGQSWSTGEPGPAAMGSPATADEILPIVLLSIVLIPALGFAGWIFYEFEKSKTACPSCKEPWCDVVYEKAFLGTDQWYDRSDGRIRQRHHHFEKIRCSHCGYLWTRET